MPATSLCLSPTCRTRVEGNVATCPTCGARMRTPRWLRVMGWVMLVVCLILMLISINFAGESLPTLLHHGDASAHTIEFAWRTFLMFGVDAVFGVITIGYALWLIVTGSYHKTMLPVLLTLAVLAIANSAYQIMNLPS